jgi:K+-sensing histidine kinase KdpD
VIVQDQGPGINQADQEKLFKPFTVLPHTKQMNPNGVGLGLFVCKVIIDKHAGDIHCYSNGEQGTIFEFRIQVQMNTMPRFVVPN